MAGGKRQGARVGLDCLSADDYPKAPSTVHQRAVSGRRFSQLLSRDQTGRALRSDRRRSARNRAPQRSCRRPPTALVACGLRLSSIDGRGPEIYCSLHALTEFNQAVSVCLLAVGRRHQCDRVSNVRFCHFSDISPARRKFVDHHRDNDRLGRIQPHVGWSLESQRVHVVNAHHYDCSREHERNKRAISGDCGLHQHFPEGKYRGQFLTDGESRSSP
jgi:hypothetical protein